MNHVLKLKYRPGRTKVNVTNYVITAASLHKVCVIFC